MSMTRRQWLAMAGLASVAPQFVSRAYAAPGAADSRFLLVFLRGAYDAANVVAPVGASFYQESRPTIALKKFDPADPQAAIELSGQWGLHPALRDSMLPLWQKNQLAFVPFAGTDDLTRSHFETQDSVEEGLPLDGPRDYGSGFLNRLSQAMGGRAAPVAFTDGLPIVLKGDIVVPNVSLKGTGKPPFDDRQSGLLTSMYKGTRFESLIAEGFDLRKTVAEQAEAQQREVEAARNNVSTDRMNEMVAASKQALTAKGFEVEARRMAGLMKDRFNLGFIDVGGWDTHVNQGGATGQLASLLSNLGSGLSGFANEMGPMWDKTVVVVLSEFGRTFRENGTKGTDHGHGSVYWVLGGSVRGGKLLGDQVAIERAKLNQDRDWPVLTEYRAMLGGLFQRMYGLDDARLAQVFPNARPRDIGLV
ncbi:DUF1501 domain-containing protein [soil metagenome]